MIQTSWSQLLMTGVFFLIPTVAHAAGFTVTPMMQEIILDEGEEAETYEASVTNDTEASVTFEISAIDFGGLDESGGVVFLGAAGEELERQYALASWMQLDTDEVTLRPGERRAIQVRIENSDSLAPGGHYGAVVFKSNSSVRPETLSVAINQVFSSLVFVKKTKGARYGLELTSVEEKSAWWRFNPRVLIRFRNLGNVHVAPRGEISVTDPLGRAVYRGIINDGSTLVLPEMIREYPVKLFPLETATLPGWYTWEVRYRYDGRESVDLWTKRMFFVPPFSSVGIVVGIFALAFWQHRRYRKHSA